MVNAHNLRVLMVAARAYPYVGGVETNVYQVSRRLARAGANVTVLSTDPSRKLPVEEVVEGVRLWRVPAWPARLDYYIAPGIYHAMQRERWDIVHCQGYHTFVPPIAMLAALRAGMPYVLTFHGGGHSSWLRNAIRKPQRLLMRPLLARAEKLIAIASFEIEFYGRELKLPPARFVLIPNGSDLPVVDDLESSSKLDGTLIVSPGRLERYKGHHRVIAALPHILARRPDVRLRVAGAGPYEQQLRRLARRLGISDRVEIRAVPPEDRQAMATLLKRAAVVTLLSDYETHPIAALEAIALKRPVLLLNTSGMRELGERGLARTIAPTSTAEQVAAAILEQLDHPYIPPQLQLPTWDDCTASLLDLYRSVATRPVCVS